MPSAFQTVRGRRRRWPSVWCLAAGVVLVGCAARTPLRYGGPPLPYRLPDVPTRPLTVDTVGQRVIVSVTGDDGAPVVGARIVLSDSAGASPLAPRVLMPAATDGSYLLAVVPGTFRLRVGRIGYVPQQRTLVVRRDAPERTVAFTLESDVSAHRVARRLADSAAAAQLARRREGASACLENRAETTQLVWVLRGWLDDRGEAERRRLVAKWGLVGVDTTDTEVITDAAICQAAADLYDREDRGMSGTPRDRDGHSLAGVFVVRVGRAYGIEVPERQAGEWALFLLAVRTRRGFAARDWLTY